MQNKIFVIRAAVEDDCALILDFIKLLATYEKRASHVVATEDILRDSLFAKRQAEVLIGEEDGLPVAFAVYFHNFSTFVGTANIYLEDLFVKEECRGRGYGRAMFARLAQIAVERGCQRLDWSCLKWNTSSIEFYERLGAVSLEAWTGYRLEGSALQGLAE